MTDRPPRPAPRVDPEAYVHPLAVLIGDVSLGARASVWPGAVLRGDTDRIVVGADSNVQDGAVVHVDRGVPASIGARVSVGHRAVVHGATVDDDCLVGMGAVLLNRVRVGRGSIVAAGAVVREGTVVPPDSLVAGVPAVVRRLTSPDGRAGIARTAAAYVALQAEHRRGDFPPYGPARAPHDAP